MARKPRRSPPPLLDAAIPLLVGFVVASAAVTAQPADFGLRRWLGCWLVVLALNAAAFRPRRFGIAWPALWALTLALFARLAYWPELPAAIYDRLPLALAALQPSWPTAAALAAVLLWALRPRPSSDWPAAPRLLLDSLHRAAQLLVALAVVLHLALAMVYGSEALEAAPVLWAVPLACAIYLGLGWIGIEGSLSGILKPWHARICLLALAVATVGNAAGLFAGQLSA